MTNPFSPQKKLQRSDIPPPPPIPASALPGALELTNESGVAPYESLFNSFDLSSVPVYNFWVEDEGNESEEKGSRDLSELPRYVVVSWKIAPDVSKSESNQKMSRTIDPIKLGSMAIDGKTYDVNGISYSPTHLQPSSMSMVKGSLSNGYLAPGVISAVVEATGIDSAPSSFVNSRNAIDEEKFLSDDSMAGISSEELRANRDQSSNGLLSRMKASSDPAKSGLYSGKTYADVDEDGASTISDSSMTFRSITSKTKRQSVVDDDVGSFFSRFSTKRSDDASSTSINVKFVDQEIDGSIDESRVSSIFGHHHAESIVALSHVMPNLAVMSRSNLSSRTTSGKGMVTFPSPPTIVPLEYVGYVLEKYKMDDSGAFVFFEEIDIPSREIGSYIDTKVSYGGAYRYRIRAIMRWSRPQMSDDRGGDFVPQPIPGAGLISSYIAGEWSRSWTYSHIVDNSLPPCPDEFNVRPDSRNKRIIVTMKVPDDSQRDIIGMNLFRRTVSHDGTSTLWKSVLDETFDVKNSIFYDRNVEYVQDGGNRYVYAAYTFTGHGEISSLSEQISATITSAYEITGEERAVLVSCAGVSLNQFGSFSVRPSLVHRGEVIVPLERTTGDRRVASATFSGREFTSSGMGSDRSYVVRIESLDTGEVVDVPFKTRFVDAETRFIEKLMSDVAVVQSAVLASIAAAGR